MALPEVPKMAPLDLAILKLTSWGSGPWGLEPFRRATRLPDPGCHSRSWRRHPCLRLFMPLRRGRAPTRPRLSQPFVAQASLPAAVRALEEGLYAYAAHVGHVSSGLSELIPVA